MTIAMLRVMLNHPNPAVQMHAVRLILDRKAA
jgi:hypothetical protein